MGMRGEERGSDPTAAWNTRGGDSEQAGGVALELEGMEDLARPREAEGVRGGDKEAPAMVMGAGHWVGRGVALRRRCGG